MTDMKDLSLPERTTPSRPGSTGDYWQKVDGLYYSTMGRAVTVFKANLTINMIIVAVGLVLVGVAIYSSLTKGADLSSAAFAGLGIVDFSTTFFLNPQKDIQKGMNNLVAIQTIYRTYLLQFENLADEQRTLADAKELTMDLTERINNDLSKITTDAITDLKSLVESAQ